MLNFLCSNYWIDFCLLTGMTQLLLHFLVDFNSQVGGQAVSRTNWHVEQMEPSIVESSSPRILTERCGWERGLIALYEML